MKIETSEPDISSLSNIVGVKEKEIQEYSSSKVIQVSSRPNQHRSKLFKFAGQPFPDPNFGQPTFQE